MSWLIWRQHRGEAALMALFVAITAALLVPTGLELHPLFHSSGAASCLAAGQDPGLCNAQAGEYTARYQHTVNMVVPYLIVLPAALGVFVGAPLLGREFDQNTWQLAWSQSVPRTRWLLWQLIVLASLVLVVSGTLSALFTWWYGPATAIKGRLNATFSAEGVVYPAQALFAFALGALAGGWLRRTMPAMAATIAGYLAVRIPTETRFRMYLIPPAHVTLTPGQLGHVAPAPQDRILTHDLIDAHGHPWPSAGGVPASAPDMPAYMAHYHLRMRYTYQPAARFWTLQWIEAGIFVALAAVLLAVLVVRVRRRAI
jgi:hypothetical protein